MSERNTAELIISGRVATIAGESGFGWQPGLAIGGGRVLAVGEAHELEALAGSQTLRWQLAEDQLVVPGVTDAHLHLISLVLGSTHIDLTGLDLPSTLDAIHIRHREMDAANDKQGWLMGHGWTMHDLGGWPDAAALDRVAPGRRISLHAHDHHSVWISAAAVAAAHIGPTTPNPEGGLIRRDTHGIPTGILHETASVLIEPAIPDPPRDSIETWLQRVAAELAALGVTGCHDPGELTGERDIVRGPALYRQLAEQDLLPLRVHSSVRAPQLARAIELGLRSGQNVGRYTMGWLKLFADGSLGSRSALLLAPYDDAPTNPPTGGPTGMALTPPEELAELLRTSEAAGIGGQVHAIGDGAVRAVLDVFEALPPNPDIPVRRRVEHAQLVDPADQPRFGQLRVAASIQPVHLRSDAPQVRAGWGARGEHAFPLRGLLDGGALIPFGTDAPVEPPDPWPGIAVALARRDPLKLESAPIGSGHAITLDRALRAACLDPAQVAGIDDLGRLAAGYRADLLVVPAAGFAQPFDAAALARTRPLATLIDGRVAYRDPRFDP